MALFTQWLPVFLVPEQPHIAPVRDNMVNNGGGSQSASLHADSTQRVLFQKCLPCGLPFPVVAAEGGTAAQGIGRKLRCMLRTVHLPRLTEARTARLPAWAKGCMRHGITSQNNQATVVVDGIAAVQVLHMGFMPPDVLCSNLVKIIPDASLYHFGILTSNVHMAWTRAVCGRLKSDYSYSNTIVYNNFPWPSPTEEQQRKIENTAQAILAARALYPNSNLAALYDPLTMPTELRRAHTLNDKAVMAAYGFSTKMAEATCVTELLNLYQRMLQEKEK